MGGRDGIRGRLEAVKHPGREGERWTAGGNKQSVNQGLRCEGGLMTTKHEKDSAEIKGSSSQKFQFVSSNHFFSTLSIIMISCFRNTPR